MARAPSTREKRVLRDGVDMDFFSKVSVPGSLCVCARVNGKQFTFHFTISYKIIVRYRTGTVPIFFKMQEREIFWSRFRGWIGGFRFVAIFADIFKFDDESLL